MGIEWNNQVILWEFRQIHIISKYVGHLIAQCCILYAVSVSYEVTFYRNFIRFARFNVFFYISIPWCFMLSCLLCLKIRA